MGYDDDTHEHKCSCVGGWETTHPYDPCDPTAAARFGAAQDARMRRERAALRRVRRDGPGWARVSRLDTSPWGVV